MPAGSDSLEASSQSLAFSTFAQILVKAAMCSSSSRSTKNSLIDSFKVRLTASAYRRPVSVKLINETHPSPLVGATLEMASVDLFLHQPRRSRRADADKLTCQGAHRLRLRVLEPANDLAGAEGDAIALHEHSINTGRRGGVGEQQGPPPVHLVVRDEQRLGTRALSRLELVTTLKHTNFFLGGSTLS
jgi:hypothetical protein